VTDEPKLQSARRFRIRALGGSLALVAIAIAALFWLWDWNWFRPLAEAKASVTLGRAVTLDRFDVAPGWITRVTVYGVKIANPAGFPVQSPDQVQNANQVGAFITIPRLSFDFDPAEWWHSGQLILRRVDADQPTINIEQFGTATGNWVAPEQPSAAPSTLQVGIVGIQGGTAHIHIAREKSDVTASIATSHTANGDVVIVDGKGTHAGQPITFHGVGGAFVALQDTSRPYPIDFALANGPTRITLKGSIRDPLALTGADLNLVLTGPDMALLLPLTGIATPSTPPYRISGRLDFQDGKIKFSDFRGQVGSSDLNGEIDVDPHGERPLLTGKLVSHQVDLADLGGFVGSMPGRVTTPGQTAGQVAQVERAEADPRLLPTTPISMPKVRAADVHLTYRGEKIIGKDVPFDAIDVKMDIDDGDIRLSPLRLRIEGGSLEGTIDLKPVDNEMAADVDVTAKHINLGRLLASAHLGNGAGPIDGTAKIKGRGASFSAVLAHGDGGFRAVMSKGGDVSSLLVDLMGLEIGKALFAAIGVPGEEAITCALADFQLQHGIFASRALEVGTTDHVITGGGRIDLSREVMELTLRTDPRHFTIGSLPTPIVVSGSFKHLHFAPAPDATARGAAAVGLGILFPPAAILPTIQFGVGDGSPCAEPASRPATR
jgi:uncharacterized protein involved in outer membrane biogenesis